MAVTNIFEISNLMSNTEQETPSPSPGPYSITEAILEQRRRQFNYGRLSTQIYVGILACLSSFSFGTSLTWSHPLTTRLEVDEGKIIWLVNIVLLGCSLGVTSCTIMLHQMGPKMVLRKIGPLYILAWWLILIPKIEVELAFRFFLGFFGISHSICGEKLLMQTVHYAIRRYILVVHSSTMLLGAFAMHAVGSVLSKFWLTFMCAMIPVLHYLLIQVVPESPVALYTRSPVAAARSLKWYRGSGNIHMDMDNIKKDWDASRQDSEAYRYMLMSKVVYRALLTIIGVTFFQVCTGYFILMFYSMQAWGVERIVVNPTADSAIIGISFVFSKLFWGSMHSLYSWKVRGLLICSCLISAVGLTLLALFLLLKRLQIDVTINKDWSLMLILAFFLFFYDMGLNYYPRILTLEYMPLQVYKRANFIVQALFWLLVFLYNLTFGETVFYVPTYIWFGVMAVITYVGTVFCYFFVVEPKGKSLVEIQLEFGGNPVGRRGTIFNQICRETAV